MFRSPAKVQRIFQNTSSTRMKSSYVRSTFIEYFTEIQGHEFIKSSSVVPLCDPTVPFVNAGMNQFKGIFLDTVSPPCPKAVNSQKCIRVGGKHNDLDSVGVDGHHHTFFEMLGNWSFGDYYKKEACQMAWELLIGPYQIKPENIVVTYFGGDPLLKLEEDSECRDIWKSIGLQSERIKPMGSVDNFWEMGLTGPCGPCTEIHYVNEVGSLTEIWNIVFIQYNRQDDGSVTPLSKFHVDTGMGLERMTALLQRVPSNYDTDLFVPIIKAIEQSTKCKQYTGKFGSDEVLDTAYRRLADHARMISICLADGAFPASSTNLKQIMRKSFKISEDIFKYKSGLLSELYDQVVESLGSVYPELFTKEKVAKKIIKHEEEAYAKLRSNLAKKWKDLVMQHPEVENLNDVELSSFALGYKEFKQTMSSVKSNVIPGEVMFKLYDTHGFPEDVIERVAKINNFDVDRETFTKLLNQHKSRHKTSFKEQTNNNLAISLNKVIEKLNSKGIKNTNDQFKYNFKIKDNDIIFKPLQSKIIAILNSKGDCLEHLDGKVSDNYYLVTENTNFYCEEGGQIADSGFVLINKNSKFNVESVFKIKGFVFLKGNFNASEINLNLYDEVILEIDSVKRLNLMRNHTGIHLLNAAVRKTLSNSVVYQVGSNVTDKHLVLNLSLYGEKFSKKNVSDIQDLVRKVIESDTKVKTKVLNNVQLSEISDVVTVPGEIYPETGLRLVEVNSKDITSRELCCGTHVSNTSIVKDFCITFIKAAGSQAPRVFAITGEPALELRELTMKAKKLKEVYLNMEASDVQKQMVDIRERLSKVCEGSGAPFGDHEEALNALESVEKKLGDQSQKALEAIVEEEMRDLSAEAEKQGRKFLVHFLRCSYMMESAAVSAALRNIVAPALVLGCANGVINVAASVPQSHVTGQFTAQEWISCIAPVFGAELTTGASDCYAAIVPTKVSLITCEQLVQDAMRAAIRYADTHAPTKVTATEQRRTN